VLRSRRWHGCVEEVMLICTYLRSLRWPSLIRALSNGYGGRLAWVSRLNYGWLIFKSVPVAWCLCHTCIFQDSRSPHLWSWKANGR
jgi:hypothetical protein